MKQHITIEQFEELDSETKIKLIKLWRNDGQIVNLLNHEDINIGQMIEFLDKNIPTEELGDYLPNIVRNPEFTEDYCDDLWQSVKEVLETKTA